MMRAIWGAAAIAAAGLVCACGPTTEDGGDGTSGSLRMQLGGNIATSGEMATIVVRNVFDTSQTFLIECHQKDHTLNGEPFCDELLVLPPGVYEVVVQTGDPNCVPEQDWYKVIVQPNETVELAVNLVCGGANGGLDVIVSGREVPIITDVNFNFLGTTTPANKFVCYNGRDVTVTVSVTDSDTPCNQLDATWFLKVDGGAYSTDLSALIVPGSESTGTGPNGECLFSATIDSAAAPGDYSLRLEVTDGAHTTSFAFPIHIVNCEQTPPPGCPNDLSNIGTGDFRITFDLFLDDAALAAFALGNQRAVCGPSNFWDVSLCNGHILFESQTAAGTPLLLLGSEAVNDETWHHVVITRINGLLTFSVSGYPSIVGIPSLASFGDLPDLALQTSVCVGVDGTQTFGMDDGILANFCAEPL